MSGPRRACHSVARVGARRDLSSPAGCPSTEGGEDVPGEDAMCELADNIADATALVMAMMDRDAEGAEVLLDHGCAAGIALVCAGKLAVAMHLIGPQDAGAILDGWRQDAEDRRTRRPT